MVAGPGVSSHPHRFLPSRGPLNTMATPQASPTCRGKIVALEGPSELVSTQLRLLPVSPQIVILPSLHHYLSDEHTEPPASTQQLIYRVHKAAQARHAAAMDFLQQSTADTKRVVFLDGGTVAARVICLEAINKGQGHGDHEKAESIFDGLVSRGVAGLLGVERPSTTDTTTLVDAEDVASSGVGGGVSEPQDNKETAGGSRKKGEDAADDNADSAEDPIIRAMRAADALDKETESLQPPDHDLELSASWFNNSKMWTRRTSSLPFVDQIRKPGSTGGSRNKAENVKLPHSRFALRVFPTPEGSLSKRVKVPPPLGKRPLATKIPTSELSWVDEACDVAHPPATPLSVTNGSHPPTPIYHVDKAQAPSGQTQQTELNSAEYGSPGNVNKAELTEPTTPSSRYPSIISTSSGGRHRRFSSVSWDGPPTKSIFGGLLDHLKDPVSIFTRPHEASAVPGGLRQRSVGSRYVDKSTDTADLCYNVVSQVESATEQAFQAVLPLLEDLVIQLSGKAPDSTLEHVFHRFKNGAYGTRASMSESTPSIHTGKVSAPKTKAEELRDAIGCQNPFLITEDSVDYGHGPPLGPRPPLSAHGAGFGYGAPAQGRLPTPPYDPHMPASFDSGPTQQFHTLSVRRQTDASVQNSLRAVLGYFIPSELWSRRPSRAGSLPEKSPLWKPVIWGAKPPSGWRAGRETDLILAIGSEKSVKKSYTSAIVGQVEKLGHGANGLSRTGRVDLRFLIASAMQVFTAQPLAQQTRDNPFTNSTLLASLLMPHLEKYLCTHPDVRFLIIEYTAEHLSTILALQKLIGAEAVQVAGILGSDDPALLKSSSSSSPAAGPEKYAYAELGSVGGLDALSNPMSPRSANVSFSKANYVLTSSASHSEIAAFVTSIRETLVAASHAYTHTHTHTHTHTPRGASIHDSPKTVKPPRTVKPNWSHFKQNTFLSTSSTLDTPPASPVDLASAHPQSPRHLPSPVTSTRSRASISTASRPGSSDRAARGVLLASVDSSVDGRRPRPLHFPRPPEGGGARGVQFGGLIESRDGGESEEEEEEELDSEERRLMPLYLRREADRGNGQKALRWLGLE
ncbi:hypothetical protein B0T25DRAFT_584936 [Lasiosphaeria hispida]|uniref:Gastric mucin-like protein n=1 Tax=Lasiosphaeria hispida TaxID=260671 RepID=A0AAJ0H9X7_9PEZI|nr:hypothetical protein B0T25DRAFT_584936 [Lasiosphaeria hispida]